jgi:hypothetical protein
MKTRKDVAAFIVGQFRCDHDQRAIPDKQLRNRSPKNGLKEPYHYGVCELRELLDFIYDGPPSNDEEIKVVRRLLHWAPMIPFQGL